MSMPRSGHCAGEHGPVEPDGSAAVVEAVSEAPEGFDALSEDAALAESTASSEQAPTRARTMERSRGVSIPSPALAERGAEAETRAGGREGEVMGSAGAQGRSGRVASQRANSRRKTP